MNIFKRNKPPTYTVCKECGVHFEPVTGFESRWGDYCHEHRAKVMTRDLKKERVLGWAAQNIDFLEKIMIKKEDAWKKKNANTGTAGVLNSGLNQAIIAAQIAASYQKNAWQGQGSLGGLANNIFNR